MSPTILQLIAAIPTDPHSYGPWWASTRGRALAERLGGGLADAVARGVRARTGRSIDPGVVLGLAVEALTPPSQLLRGLRSPATADPTAYLVRSLVNALAREIGSDVRLDAVASSLAQHARRAPVAVRLPVALRAVHRELLPGTPPRLRPTLAVVVARIADRAAEGSLSRLHTRSALDAELLALGWSGEQLRALVNAVIGARPDHARSSLLAGFLVSEDWRPRASPAHRRAIEAYGRRMARAETARERVPAAA